MSNIVAIADALVAVLKAGTFTQPFEAVRDYVPQYDLADLKLCRVTVVPKSTAEDLATRSSVATTHQVDVAVQGRAPALTDRDMLMALTLEIAAEFRMQRLEACPDVICTRIERQALYDRDHLREHGVMTTVLTLTFEALE